MIVVGGWPGRRVVGGNGRFGVLPAEFAALGPEPSPLQNDVDPGDEATEFAWVIESLPSSGTVVATDAGGFSHTGAPDGTYETVYRLYTWAPGGPVVDRGTATITTIFGTGAAGRIYNVAVSLTAGTATGEASATAPGALMTAVASLVAGSFSAQPGSAIPGQVFTAVASLLAGAGTTRTVYRPTGDAGGSGWVATPAGPLFEAIDEITPNDADFISTQVAGSAPTYHPIGPIAPGSFTLRVRADTIGPGATLTVTLFDAFGAPLATVSTPINSTRTTHELDFDLTDTATQFSLEVAP